MANRGPRVPKCFVVPYAILAAAWAVCWVPFGFGYEFPWRSAGFRHVAEATACGMVGVGAVVLVARGRSWRSRGWAVVAVAWALSAFGCWAMWDWITRGGYGG